VNCAEEERRDGEALEGVMPPTPCREFMDAFLSSVGVDARECWLMELGDRWRGLRGGILPFGDDVEFFRWGKPLLGETLGGEEGRDAADAALIESRFGECEKVSLLFVDCGNGVLSLATFWDGENAIAA
jgi:hypothetical protein